MSFFIPQKGLPDDSKLSLPVRVVTGLTINSMLFFFVWADFLIWFYQTVYFGLKKIPKKKRSEYVIMERYKLPGLTLAQKWSCGYCEYANGIILWLKAVANQTEVYSCAIKYPRQKPREEYQEKFYEQGEFAGKKKSN